MRTCVVCKTTEPQKGAWKVSGTPVVCSKTCWDIRQGNHDYATLITEYTDAYKREWGCTLNAIAQGVHVSIGVISNLRRGRYSSKPPKQHLTNLINFLDLTEQEANRLLYAAGHL